MLLSFTHGAFNSDCWVISSFTRTKSTQPGQHVTVQTLLREWLIQLCAEIILSAATRKVGMNPAIKYNRPIFSYFRVVRRQICKDTRLIQSPRRFFWMGLTFLRALQGIVPSGVPGHLKPQRQRNPSLNQRRGPWITLYSCYSQTAQPWIGAAAAAAHVSTRPELADGGLRLWYCSCGRTVSLITVALPRLALMRCQGDISHTDTQMAGEQRASQSPERDVTKWQTHLWYFFEHYIVLHLL